MYLVIAEKPSVSKAIAEVIGASKKRRRVSGGKGLHCQLVFWPSCRICSTGFL